MGKAIAIVGMACRFAGAESLQDYWRMCLEGRHAFGPIPADRWDAEFFQSDNKRDADRSYAPAGAFIEDIRSFPAVALQIPPRRVEVMDPQQRLAIEIGIDAIQDAGRTPDQMPERTAVFMGVTAMEYRTILNARVIAMMAASGQLGTVTDPEAILASVENVLPARPFTPPGVLANMVACAVAQELGLQGAAYSVDAACSSSIVALHDAVAHLRLGTIDAALAGGVYLSISPESHVGFSRIGAMSRQGLCLPFDARADGFVQGDGAGILVLKRLEDAQRDGDRIYATIEGIAANNDAGLAGPMAPVKSSQTSVIKDAWKNADVDPSLLGYLETHGTGTLAGDKAEFDGVVDAIGPQVKHAAIGSSKANIGHTMSAAGVAGVIRAAMSAYEGQIPPLAGFESPKSDLGIEETGFYIPQKPHAWEEKQRVAAVSSFGFGGTNTHVVLQSQEPEIKPDRQAELVLLSSYDEAALRKLALRTGRALQTSKRATVAGVARAWSRRKTQPWRLAVVADNMHSLAEKLIAVGEGKIPENTALSKALDEPKVAFLYPGQGAQRIGMLRGIRERFARVKETIESMEQAIGDRTALPLSHYLYPELRSTPVDAEQAESELTATEHTQPVLYAVAIALTRILEDAGVKPTVTAGHSVGEFAAAVASGVLSAEDGARFVTARGRAMADMTGDRGAMLAIRGDVQTAESILVPGAIVANINHPQQTVIAGTTNAIDQVEAKAHEAGITPIRLNVSHGFHSEVFDGLDMKPAVAAVQFQQGHTPVASGIVEGTYQDPETAARVFDIHATSTVHFTRALEECEKQGANIFVQVGAGGPISTFAKRTLTEHRENVINLASNDDEDGGASLLAGLGALWTRGVDIEIDAFTHAAPIASVPPLELPKESYWGVKDTTAKRAIIDVEALEKRAQEAAALRIESKEDATETAGQAQAAGGDAIESAVKQAVAKASAYPLDALEPSMRLMEDLGFDSMMITDLIEELTRTVPGLTGIPQEFFVKSPTIADLTDYARNPQSDTVDASVDDTPLSAYALSWEPSTLQSTRAHTRPLDILITGENEELNDPIAMQLQRERHDVTIATLEKAAGVDHPDVLVFCASNADHPAIDELSTGADSALHLTETLLDLLKTWAKEDKKPDVYVAVEHNNPWHAALAGATRALAREWSDNTIRVIHLERDETPVQRSKAIAQEILADDQSNEARWAQGQRYVRGFRPMPSASAWAPSSDQKVLITGGTRGIGRMIGETLAKQAQQVILVGRSAPDQELQAVIESSNGKIVAAQADVTSLQAMQQVVQTHGPIHALIHSAGILADGALEEIDPALGRKAREIKARGWQVSVEACGETLERAVAIGSWAGRFGNRHQTHYASANALMSALVANAPESIHATVSEFGPWIESDMAATIPESIRTAMRNQGVDFVTNAVGEQAILEDLGRTGGIVVRGRRVPTNTAVHAFSETLSTDTHPFLVDHSIEGTPVLPLAYAADRLAQVSTLNAPFELRDLTLFQGVQVTKPLTLQAHTARGVAELRSGKDGATLHYRATIAPATATPELAPLQGGEPAPISLERFYQELTFHGPLLAGIEEIQGVGDDFVYGRVRTGTPQEWIPASEERAWTISPLAIDSAMQMAGLVAFHREGRAGTPLSIERLAILAPITAPVVTAEVRFGELVENRFQASLALRDDDGELLAVADGIAIELRDIESASQDAAGVPEDKAADEKPLQIKPEWTDPSLWPGYQDIALRVQMVEAMGMKNPYFDLHEGTARNISVVDGREVINFSSYNYLGYSGDPRVLEATEASVRKYGTSVSASRVASGERPFHRDLEAALAKANDCEDALVFSGGHATNVNTIGHLFGPKDLILHDELIHDSCLQGIKLSGAARRAFVHDDPADLERQLKKLRGHYEKVLILVEGVYSMDGDIAKIPEYVALREKYHCLLMIDEAHSFGTVGPRGLGVRDHYGLKGSDADIWMGTMSKSLASMGGWISGSKELIMYMRYTAPGFVYAAGIPPALGVAALTSLNLMLEEPERVEKLQSNSLFFYNELKKRGINTGPSHGESPVIPVITGDSMIAMQLSQQLLDDGINAKPIVYPAVAEDASRLRLFLSSTHTEEELEHSAEKISQILRSLQSS